ncbi:putative nucleic acid-binding protein [Actinoplanes octamycinicus]|uniref:Ribonuclease VapC n=1 Tax=Actinoplanes octamycinicus TaxID=135948 RepID=A0A7W7M784_9ACTN|nr:PIN domain nuclease [Actinoplanes octamycinicus]MBB4739486.1 putative nucleic acid-binding protein [Actinoplanes octamycinicus]GIE54669.1 ribonuclease VapC [Actinoplanes octamycinicus]
MTAQFLVDTSAYFRLAREVALRDAWGDYLRSGLFSICELTELEIYYTARSMDHRRELGSVVRERYKWALMPDAIYHRALEVQELLAHKGAHRSAGAVDLLVAATAESLGMTVLHYDRDFELVAGVTGQPTRWIAKPGTVD